MLWIKNVELQSEGRRFTKLTSKYIRISYKNSVSLSKNENTYQNESTIKWDNANLTIPAVWDADVDFEVFDKHEFGYNPEELKTVLYGTFRVSKNQKDGKYPVLSSAENDKKVGFVLMDFTKPSPQTSITATTEKKEESSSKSIPSISLPKCAQVSSILLRKTKKPLGKIYLLMKSDEGKILSKTDPINPISGEYLLTNKYKIESLAPKQSLLFEVHDAATDELKGNGKIFYGSCSKSNKVDMLDESGNTLGELYFKLQNQSTPLPQQYSKPEPSLYKLKALSQSKLRKLATGNTNETSRIKKVSAIHSNREVFFPQQKRFMNYQDTPSGVVSYSNLSSMKFMEPASKKYYRGASFGKGRKVNFAEQHKYNPGVGQYKLPSIFDKY